MTTSSKIIHNMWVLNAKVYHWNVWDAYVGGLVTRVYEPIPGFDTTDDNE